jgi:hypothetical protein
VQAKSLSFMSVCVTIRLLIGFRFLLGWFQVARL